MKKLFFLLTALLLMSASEICVAQVQHQHRHQLQPYEQRNNFSLFLGLPGLSLSLGNQWYPQQQYMFAPQMYAPQQIITPMVPYARQPIQVPVNVCQDTYTQDQFGTWFKYTRCWPGWGWQ